MKVIEADRNASSSSSSSSSLLLEVCHNVFPHNDNTPPPSPPPLPPPPPPPPPQPAPTASTTVVPTSSSSCPASPSRLSSPPSPSSSPPADPPPVDLALAKALHQAFTMHSTKTFLPSPAARLYSSAGMTSPAAAAAAAAAATSLPLMRRGAKQTSSGYCLDGGGGGGGDLSALAQQVYSSHSTQHQHQHQQQQQQASPAKLQRAASLVYAAHHLHHQQQQQQQHHHHQHQRQQQQEAFPYGLSGVPTLPSYGYSSELYSYATNGFPRKSRICSYCSKVFTRSTTRRYHEKRCPLLRAAGSLMKGSRGSSSIRPLTSASANGYNSYGLPDRVDGVREIPSHPHRPAAPAPGPHPSLGAPPTVSVAMDTSSVPVSSSSSSAAVAAAVSAGAVNSASVVGTPASDVAQGVYSRSQVQNTPAQFNGGSAGGGGGGGGGVYGSRYVHTAVSTTSPVLGDSAQLMHAASRHSILDHNQNSILPTVKQEQEIGEDDRGEDMDVAISNNKDSSALNSPRNKLTTPQMEEQGQGQLMFSPLSATSGSRSDEEEMMDSDDGGTLLTKASVEDSETKLQKLRLRQYRLAQLKALQASHRILQASQTSVQASLGTFQGSHAVSQASPAAALQISTSGGHDPYTIAALQASQVAFQSSQGVLQASQAGLEVSQVGNADYNLNAFSMTGTTSPAEKPPSEISTAADASLTPLVKEVDGGQIPEGSFQEEENTQDYVYPEVAPEDEDTEEEEDEEADEEEEDRMKKCGICSEEFEHPKELRAHERVHQKYKPNSCRFCGQRFIKISMRIAHQRLHTARYTLGCVVCGLHVLTKYGLRQHVRREHCRPSSGEAILCRYCTSAVDSVYDLQNHYIAHRRRIPPSERESIRYLPNALPALVMVSSLIDDEDEEEEEEEACQELATPSNDSKTSHDSPVHAESDLPPPPPLMGPILPMSAAALLDENSSIRKNGGLDMGGVIAAGGGRSREKEWCRICEKEIPKSAMRYHEREHAGQKPYECPLCKKRFGYKNNMKSHMKLHAGIKPYQCQVCGAKFTRGSTLRRHARRHGVNNDTIWDFFVRKTAASRTALLSQAAVNGGVVDPSMASSKLPGGPLSKLSPQGVPGRRGMSMPILKADGTAMALMGGGGGGGVVGSSGGGGLSQCETTGTIPDKKCQPAGFPAGAALPQTMFPNYHTVTQTLLQPYLASQQYLGYASGFPPPPPSSNSSSSSSSAVHHPPLPPSSSPPPTSVDTDVALDFSMPDKQRRRSASSSSSASTSAQRSPSVASLTQGHSFHSPTAAMERSPVNVHHSQGASSYWSRPLSATAVTGGRRSFSSHNDHERLSQDEEMRQRSFSFNGSYQRYHHHKFSRSGRYSLGEGRPGDSSRYGAVAADPRSYLGGCYQDVRQRENRLTEIRHGDVRAGGDSRHADMRYADKRVADSRLGDIRHGDGRIGDSRFGDVRLEEMRCGDTRVGELRHGDGSRVGDGRHGENRLGDERMAEGRRQGPRLGDALPHYHANSVSNNTTTTATNRTTHPLMTRPNQLTTAIRQEASTQDSLCCRRSSPLSSHSQGESPCHPTPDSQGLNNVNNNNEDALDMSVNSKAGLVKSGLGTDGFQHNTLSSLTLSGRLFHCRPCDCFYTDLTMFRLHQKIHLPDQPFVCFLCRQDCHEKIGFSRHMLAHLR